MANMNEILPKGEYKVKVVGPFRDWEYNGQAMKTDSIQFEGYEQYWVDVNRKADSPAPTPGTVIKGYVEQDENAKYPPKFKKESNGNFSGGGSGKATPGAIWAQNVATATEIVNGYYESTKKSPKSFDEYMNKVKAVAPMVGKMVDEFVAKTPAATPAPASNSEAGETAAPAASKPEPTPGATDNVSIEDISDEDLGDW